MPGIRSLLAAFLQSAMVCIRGCCLEMIRTDFMAGAHLEGGSPKVLLLSMLRLSGSCPQR